MFMAGCLNHLQCSHKWEIVIELTNQRNNVSSTLKPCIHNVTLHLLMGFCVVAVSRVYNSLPPVPTQCNSGLWRGRWPSLWSALFFTIAGWELGKTKVNCINNLLSDGQMVMTMEGSHLCCMSSFIQFMVCYKRDSALLQGWTTRVLIKPHYI